ncbi:MAG TPA: hypothetical protein VK502_03880 [Candidatus Saccharimonadales bacterium]|nr:hypothetical protein [Candidatus Saccharimonadales bacterium]
MKDEATGHVTIRTRQGVRTIENISYRKYYAFIEAWTDRTRGVFTLTDANGKEYSYKKTDVHEIDYDPNP